MNVRAECGECGIAVKIDAGRFNYARCVDCGVFLRVVNVDYE